MKQDAVVAVLLGGPQDGREVELSGPDYLCGARWMKDHYVQAKYKWAVVKGEFRGIFQGYFDKDGNKA